MMAWPVKTLEVEMGHATNCRGNGEYLAKEFIYLRAHRWLRFVCNDTDCGFKALLNEREIDNAFKKLLAQV